MDQSEKIPELGRILKFILGIVIASQNFVDIPRGAVEGYAV